MKRHASRLVVVPILLSSVLGCGRQGDNGEPSPTGGTPAVNDMAFDRMEDASSGVDFPTFDLAKAGLDMEPEARFDMQPIDPGNRPDMAVTHPDMARGYCGDGACEAGETQTNCCSDCGCPTGASCTNGACQPNPRCGDGVCNGNETQSSCCGDCGCPSGYQCNGSACECTEGQMTVDSGLSDTPQFCYNLNEWYTQKAAAYLNDGSQTWYIPQGGSVVYNESIGTTLRGWTQCCMLDGCLGNLSCPTPNGPEPCICLQAQAWSQVINQCSQTVEICR